MMDNRNEGLGTWLFLWAYVIGNIGTFVYLTFFDGYNYTAWNWIIAIPVNFFLAQIWPLFWLIINPLFG